MLSHLFENETVAYAVSHSAPYPFDVLRMSPIGLQLVITSVDDPYYKVACRKRVISHVFNGYRNIFIID